MRFLAGFGVATVLWGAAALLYAQGKLGAFGPDAAACAPEAAQAAVSEVGPDKGARRARRPRRARSGRASPGDGREATLGEDIGWDEERTLDMAGGEEQLSRSAIEAGFDGAMPKIRRCLVLVPAEGEVRGQLVFGMRVGADGAPKAVNLSGPAVVTAGESGACLRSAVQAMRFPPFQGPDTVFKYPITLQ